MEKYRNTLNLLLKSGDIYECYETEEELEMQRKILISRGLPPKYTRDSIKISDEQKMERKPYFRFKINHSIIET